VGNGWRLEVCSRRRRWVSAGLSNGQSLSSPVAAGDHITLVITGVTNPAGSGSLNCPPGLTRRG
jgi:hypothetical protein